jgi:hypothetical protein
MDRTLRKSKANFLRLPRAVCNMVQPAPKSQPKIAFSPRMNLLPGGHARSAAKTRHLHQAREQTGIFEVVRAPRVIHNSKLSAMMGAPLLERLWAAGQGRTPPSQRLDPRANGTNLSPTPIALLLQARAARIMKSDPSDRDPFQLIRPLRVPSDREHRALECQGREIRGSDTKPKRRRVSEGRTRPRALLPARVEQPSVSERSRIGAGSGYLSDLRA